MSREMGFSLSFIAEYLPRFKAGKLSAQDMIDAILARVAEIDKLMTELGVEQTLSVAYLRQQRVGQQAWKISC